MTVGRSENESIAAAKQELATALGAVERLDRALAAAAYDAKQPLFAARVRAQAARSAIAEHWQLAEAAAQSVVSALQDDRTHALVGEARELLCRLYLARLQDARAARLLPEIAAFTNLIRRYDDGGRFAADLAGESVLAIAGPAGRILRLRAVAPGADGRMVARGDETTVTIPVAGHRLASGRWQVADDEVILTVKLDPGAGSLTWPETLPRITDHDLRYVPPAPGGSAFLLGRTEVTHDQYLAFVNDPAVLAKVRPAFLASLERTLGDRPIPLLPRLVRNDQILWDVVPDDNDGIAGFSVPKALSGRPVTGISRDDADAFCAWLAGKARSRVRLPSSAEWRQAAGGSDPLRVFPWGETFDASFTVTAFDGAAEPASRRVGTKPADVGPFGHLDLAGNVHEWLSDRAGRIPGEIAGGSYGDELAHEFAVAAHAKADPTQPFSPIGFRILVELP